MPAFKLASRLAVLCFSLSAIGLVGLSREAEAHPAPTAGHVQHATEPGAARARRSRRHLHPNRPASKTASCSTRSLIRGAGSRHALVRAARRGACKGGAEDPALRAALAGAPRGRHARWSPRDHRLRRRPLLPADERARRSRFEESSRSAPIRSSSVAGPLVSLDAHLTKGRLVEGERLSGLQNTVLHFDPLTEEEGRADPARSRVPSVFRLARSLRFGNETSFVYRLVASQGTDLGTLRLPSEIWGEGAGRPGARRDGRPKAVSSFFRPRATRRRSPSPEPSRPVHRIVRPRSKGTNAPPTSGG